MPEDILRRIVEDPRSERFIVRKLWAYFAEDSPEEGASFHQRAVPLLEMLERALHEGVPVTWGV